jgi:GLPGLI family protein
MATGGPENFSGLPGMILGIAMPRANVTWFATKLELAEVKETDFKITTRGKKTTIPGLKSDVNELVKRWGKYAHRYMWMIMI